ncbi:AI-2E family transporter [Filomicrobium sp.]|uniref:AI-2E family transporter n=1 Tax=Filomicrobium sp. TaxID=2024831 RepID=UPI00258F1A1A|nr:AI-2E family transporter [Filomicrobium sp.]MCV0370974.1 AI-2E family transporter [Filomicrobium sp.]
MTRNNHDSAMGTARWALIVFSVGALVVAAALALWQIRAALLLAFASVVFAVVLLAIAHPIEKFTSLSRRWSVPISGLVLLTFIGLFSVLIGTQLYNQFGELRQKLPAALEQVEERLGVKAEQLLPNEGGSTNAASRPSGLRNGIPDVMGAVRSVTDKIMSAGSLLLNGLVSLALVIVGGVFLAFDPTTYRRGIVLLVPKDRQSQADSALRECGRVLQLWLRAQLISMGLVGLLSGVGAWAIGLPAPLAVGFFAGLTEFIPIVGPWIGAVPALLIALSVSWEMAVWTAVLFLAVQQLESFIITPLVQQQVANIPPFVVLFGILALGLLFGPVGVLVAGPLGLIAYFLVTELYVKDTLNNTPKSDSSE